MSLLFSLSVEDDDHVYNKTLLDWIEGHGESPNSVALLNPERPAVLNVLGETGDVLLYDTLDALVLSVYEGAAHALATNEAYVYSSFDQRDAYSISVKDGVVEFRTAEGTATASLAATTKALRDLGSAYGELLKKVFPQEEARWRRFLDRPRGLD